MSGPIPLPVPRPQSNDAHAAARDRLGASLRSLLDVAVRSGANADELTAAAEQADAIAAQLAAAKPVAPQHDNPFHPFSLVGGTAHPLAPQLVLERTADGVTGTVCLGERFEGGPRLAHGGVLALLFDHAMGAAVYLAGHAAMTRTLDVVYEAPTPLLEQLRVHARVDGISGRRVHVSASIEHGEVTTATASAVFVTLTSDNVARIFADRA